MEETNTKISKGAGQALGWIGLVCGIVGCFWWSIFLGIVAIVLGLIGVFSPQKGLNIFTMVMGVIALIIGIV